MLLGLGLIQPIAQQPSACMVQPLSLQSLRIGVRVGMGRQPLQPARVIVLPHKGLEEPYRHPFMAVVVALAQTGVFELVLKRLCGLAQVVQQGGECGQGGHQR